MPLRSLCSLRILSPLRTQARRSGNPEINGARVGTGGGDKRMSLNRHEKSSRNLRVHPRIHGLSEISVGYEGFNELVCSRPPDISTRGMFINTARRFPEGAVLN